MVMQFEERHVHTIVCSVPSCYLIFILGHLLDIATYLLTRKSFFRSQVPKEAQEYGS